MSRCCGGLSVRLAQPHDWERVNAVLVDWWAGRDLTDLLPRLFFRHFRSTSLVAEVGDQLVGFLVGFPCPTHSDEAYVHFAGVHPAWRRSGLARDLYERFFRIAERHGRTVVRAITSPVNADSIAFHRALGFAIEPGDGEIDGLAVTLDDDGPGEHRVHFVMHLDSSSSR
jgi:ribosomal protein S18 acetylase RimI-like enzyme